MVEYIHIKENGFYLAFRIGGRNIRLLHFGTNENVPKQEWIEKNSNGQPLVKATNNSDFQQEENRIKYQDLIDRRNENGREIVFYLYDRVEGVTIKCIFLFISKYQVVKMWTEVGKEENSNLVYETFLQESSKEVTIETFNGQKNTVKVAFPTKRKISFQWDEKKETLGFSTDQQDNELVSSIS
ncbi:hypothetical protein [Aquibacillus salsiterrae]|uniref:Uncharacterized protein n=1 Tax=Aquibacillus salsiterrae TaxID=2950439 RepID=A0A9X3WCH0_9BACI|nr:hypothetical protein [Aquibacillus salsiterrae]MDC3416073.1 hypothetical protein [Aquibacillus salsiterrae]